ncbi:MAG TPA: hypothetical protein PLH70_05795 [Bacteroidales bacterium]|nr:hypothetical protein [Bacteroidales bacterium]HQB75295.1 hypothetical protein [Bacteroidales bacterium]
MKKWFFISSLLLLFLFGRAQEESALKIYGALSTDQRVTTSVDSGWIWNETRLDLKLEKKVNRGKFYANLWARNFGVPKYNEMGSLFSTEKIDPFNIQLREAYFQVDDFLVENLDLKIGRQRIAWGTADKMNPTDNLNPLDMEDIFDLGRRRGSDAINLTYYLKGDFSIQGVWIPFFQPANLPAGVFAGALMPSFDIPEDSTMNLMEVRINQPNIHINKPKLQSTFGFRLKGIIKSVDLSVSYLYGVNGIPELTQIEATPSVNIYPWYVNVDVDVQLSYFRNHIFGIDFSTNIFGLGFWGEAAIIKPDEDIRLKIIENQIVSTVDPTITDSLILDKDKPYVKWILGTDYHFSRGGYINFQWMHGFFHERGQSELNDYFFLQFNQPFFNGQLSVTPLSGSFIVNSWKELKNNYAFVYMPEITYNPIPEVGITISYIWMKGKGAGMFSAIQDYDMFVIKAKYSF